MKFALGAVLIIGSVSLMIVEGVKTTGTYFFTPTELVAHTRENPNLHDVALKVSAKVVRGSIHRDNAHQRFDFEISDSTTTFPVTYVGLVPDTFTDANDIDVVVQGKWGRDGTFHAVDVLAKCGSRYDAAWKQQPAAKT
jgi:cytochrome c-type biogenesis protein CcmE